jgi:hypothetical protein
LLDISDSEWAKSKSNTLRDKVKDNRTHIIDALDAVTILDPACGSGAFPMGMLQLMLKTYERLESRFDPYKTKLTVIQNNIFGVDIEPMAVEISRLRAWLSLIVDEDDPQSVDPLPNLDFKFVCANSLIPLESSKQIDWLNSANSNLHEKLTQIRKEYFGARKPHTKKAAQDKYYKLTKAPEGMFDDTRTKQLKSFDPFKNSKPAEFYDNNQMFGIGNGFDIVIGNPPYVQVKKTSIPESEYPYSAGKDKGKQNLYKVFVEHGFNVADINGVVCYITQSSLLCDISSSGTRELLLTQVSLQRFIEFPKVSTDKNSQVFDTVLQGTCIVLFRNNKPVPNHAFLMSSGNNTSTIDCVKSATIFTKDIQEIYPQQLYIPLVTGDKEMQVFYDASKGKIKLHSLLAENQQGDFNLGNDKMHFGPKPSDVLMYRGNGFRRFTPVVNVNKSGESEFIIGDFKNARVKQNEENAFLISHNISGTTDEHRLVFTVTTKNKFLCGDSINKCLLSDQDLNSVVLGILNSKLLDWIFRKTSTNNHVNSYEIEALPFPNIELLKSAIGNDISKLVENILDEKQLDRHADTSSTEADIDKLVYQIYGLTEDEIEVIEKAIK